MGRYYTIRTGSEIHFGKHKGKKSEWVAENDPEYIKWLHLNLKGMRIKGCIRKILETKGITL